MRARMVQIAKHHAKQIVKAVIDFRGEGQYFRRLEAYDLFRTYSPAVAVDVGRHWYFVSTADYGLSRVVFGKGSYEADVMRATFDLLGDCLGRSFMAGNTFVDVGANIGTSTVPAIADFGAESVVAFEPEPMNFRLLKCNVVANGLEDKVAAYPMGLSDSSRDAELEYDKESWGDHRVRLRTDLPDGPYGESSRPVLTVKLTTFDESVREMRLKLDDIGLVWMDIQGHEAHMLRGGSSLTESAIPVAMEYWPYGLHRSDGLTLLHEVVARHYSQVIDVRASMDAQKAIVMAADDLEQLERKYSGLRYTDLILLS